jgi:hypothetical protein
LATQNTESNDFKNIFRTTKKLVRNPVFTFICIAAAIEGLLQNSFIAFTTLFIEYQYRLSSGFSSLISGALAVPSLIIGSLLSGFLIKRFQLEMKGCLVFLCVLLLVNVFAYTGYLFSCKEPIFILNSEQATKDFQTKFFDKIDNAADNCYLDRNRSSIYDCDQSVFKPVCMKSSFDIVFESACMAGCLGNDKSSHEYSDCSYAQCISNRLSAINNIQSSSNVTLENGLCQTPSTCGYKLFISYISIVLVLFFTGLIYIPYMKITFGCVVSAPEMSAIALGIKQLAMLGVGSIPGWS